MKHNIVLTIASLLTILFMTFHLTDDILHQGGMARGGFLASVPILVVWLYGTLVLAERRWGTSSSFSGRCLGRPCPSSTRRGRGSPSLAERSRSGHSSRGA